MTPLEIVEQVTAAGGVLSLSGDGERIRAELPEDALALVDVLREHRDEVIRLLRERELSCYVHGKQAQWWNRADGSPVCGRCHPDPFAVAVQKAKQEGPPILPEGVRLVRWEPKAPPIAITTWAVVNNVPQFVRTTLAQLEAAMQGKSWFAGSWNVRELCERLEQVGVKVEVAV